GLAHAGVVAAGDGGAHGDAHAVPGVDDGNGEREVGGFFVVEVLAELDVEVVGRVVLRNQGERFGPGEGGALPVAVVGGFPPGVEAGEPLLGLAGFAGVLPVHIDAEGAAVDLRSAQLHEFQQRLLDAAGFVDVAVNAGQRVVTAGSCSPPLDALFHG